MAVHFLVFLPISSRNSIQEYQIHYSKWDKHIQNVLQHCDDFQLFSEGHNLAGCADSLLLLPRPPFVYKGFATTAPQQRHFLQRAHGLRGETWNTSGKPHAVACCTSRSTASRSTGMQLAQVLRLVTVINRSWPVTMHDDQGPVEKEGRDGGPLKLLTWPFGRWTIDSSLP